MVTGAAGGIGARVALGLAASGADVAANCAGINDGAPAEEMSLEQWRRLIDVNPTGVFIACQLEGRAMLEAGGGSIVNIGSTSTSASIANRGLAQAHYNASKAGVVHSRTRWRWSGPGGASE